MSAPDETMHTRPWATGRTAVADLTKSLMERRIGPRGVTRVMAMEQIVGIIAADAECQLREMIDDGWSERTAQFALFGWWEQAVSSAVIAGFEREAELRRPS